jgi:TonB family protein
MAQEKTVIVPSDAKISPASGVSAPMLQYGPEAPWPVDAQGKKEFPPGMKPGVFHKGKPLLVNVSIMVGSDGAVRDAKILKPGYADFDANAIKTVRLFRFKPALKNGEPIAVHVVVQIGFWEHGHAW